MSVCVCVCARARAFTSACLSVRVCVGAVVGVGAYVLVFACPRVALLIQHATRRYIIICVLSGSTIFFHIIS